VQQRTTGTSSADISSITPPVSTSPSKASSLTAAVDLSEPCPAETCEIPPGSYRLGAGDVVPGLEITFPSGWQTTERTAAELRLESGRLGSGVIRIWSDMIPVKSTGTGHGTTRNHGEARTFRASLGHTTLAAVGRVRRLTATFHAGHASSILVTRSTAKALVRGHLLPCCHAPALEQSNSGHYVGH
jgi:hypothetical protein